MGLILACCLFSVLSTYAEHDGSRPASRQVSSMSREQPIGAIDRHQNPFVVGVRHEVVKQSLKFGISDLSPLSSYRPAVTSPLRFRVKISDGYTHPNMSDAQNT